MGHPGWGHHRGRGVMELGQAPSRAEAWEVGRGLDDSVHNRSKVGGAKKEKKCSWNLVVFCLVSLFSL